MHHFVGPPTATSGFFYNLNVCFCCRHSNRDREQESGPLLQPSHTTGHAGPHPAVRNVEVPQTGGPERSGILFAGRAVPTLRRPVGIHPILKRELHRPAWTSVEHDRDLVRTLSIPFGPSRERRPTCSEALRYYDLC